MSDRRSALLHRLCTLLPRLCTLLASTFAAACGSDEVTHQPFRAGAGWHELLDWEGIPSFDERGYRMFSSHDRDERSQYPFLHAGNKDFNNFLAVCGERPTLLFQVVDGSGSCDDGIDGYLIAAADGAGFVSRMLFSLITLQQNSLVTQNIRHERVRIYVDDMQTPLYSITLAELKRGTTEPFVPPLAGWSSGAFTSYVPIEYTSKLRVYLDALSVAGGYYHQIETRTLPPAGPIAPALPATQDAAVEVLHQRARDTTSLERWGNVDAEVPPATTFTLLDRAGAGTLRALHLRVPRSESAELEHVWFEAQWDDRVSPAIRLPLAALFAARSAVSSFDTLPMRVSAQGDSLALSLYLPMPFAARSRLSLENESNAPLRVQAELAGTNSVPAADWGYLHATAHRRGAPFADEADFSVLELRGRGKYVGSVIFMSGRSEPSWAFSDPFNFLEGDPTLTVDGARNRGTGTEEYFDGGIYFREGTFDSWFASAPYAAPNADGESASVTLVRWNVLSNAIDYRNRLELGWEHGLKNPQLLSEFSAVSFFYAK